MPWRGIHAAAMEHGAGKDGDAARRSDDRIAGIVAEIADQIVGRLVAEVLHTLPGSRPVVGQQIDRAVLLRHVVERTPAGDVGAMRGRHIAGILMPGELHPLFRKFHHELLEGQIGVGAEQGAADVGHQVAEDERLDRSL